MSGNLLSDVESSSNTGELDIDLHNVCYNVTIGDQTKELLKNVNLHMGAGEMAALMGPSGAGKSTLLDLIADRKYVGQWSGEILINQTPRSQFFNRISAYVLQDNCHISTLTVEETFFYAAWVRLPLGTSSQFLKTRVNTLLDMMGMTSMRSDVVSGISSGYMKRLSIGVEIVALPYILFLDEPTSGLDSSTAFEVMRVVQGLARMGRNCLITIHQPSPEVFALFDRLVLLQQGRVIYSGKVSTVAEYFTSPGMDYPPLLAGQNAAEYVIDIAGGKLLATTNTTGKSPSSQDMEESFTTSSYFTPPLAKVGNDPLHFQYVRMRWPQKFSQLSMLLHRGLRAGSRDVANVKYTLAKNLWLGIFIGIVFKGVPGAVEKPFILDGQTSQSVDDFAGLLFFLLVYVWLSNGQIIPTGVHNSKLFHRELASETYCSDAYWLATILVELPLLLFSHTMFVTLVYFICGGFSMDAGYYWYFWLFYCLANVYAMLWAQFLAYLTGESLLAFAIYPILFYILSMFSSFTIRIKNIAPALRWMSKVTFVRWTFQGLMMLEFEQYGDQGDELLEDYGFGKYTKLYCVIVLLVNIVTISVLFFFALRKKKSKIIYVASLGQGSAQGSGNPIPRVSSPGLEISDGDNDEGDALPGGGRATLGGFDRERATVALRVVSQRFEDFILDAAEELEILPPSSYPVFNALKANEMLARVSELTETESAADPVETMESQQQIGNKLFITFRGVSLTLPTARSDFDAKRILSDVTGHIGPGLCALMGPSASGKTSLLQLLHGRGLGRCRMEGELLFNNTPRTPAFQRQMAFVSAEDVHIAVLTVMESMLYAATLRMDFSTSPKKRIDRVFQVLDMLGLRHHADTVVGNHILRGLSGGQKRRLSIGVEIVHFPSVILIDEATTGLDSTTSDEVIQSVKNLSDQGRTVMLSIHQPSPKCFAMFDTLLLLSSGEVCYFGPASAAVSYFRNSPFQFPCDDDMNPGDFVVSIAGGSMPDARGNKPMGRAVAAYFTCTDEAIAAKKRIEEINSTFGPEVKSKFTLFGSYPTPRWFQYYILTKRYITFTLRNRRPVRIGFLRHVLIGLLYGVVYFKMQDDSGNNSTGNGDAYNMRFSLSFFSILFITLVQQQTIPIYFNDKVMLESESRRAKAYSVYPFWVSSWTIYFPQLIGNTVTFGTLVYFLAAYRPGAKYFLRYLVPLNLAAICGFFVCQLTAALSPSPQTAMSVYPVVVFTITSVSGYFLYLDDLPLYIRPWAPLISPVRWALQSIIGNELSDNPELLNGDEYLATYNMDGASHALATSYLFLLCAALLAILIAVLKFNNLR